MLYECVLSTFLLSTWACFVFFRRSTLHGGDQVKRGVHKDFFILFYLNGLLWMALCAKFSPTRCTALLCVHLLRRFFESGVYCYKIFSKMSALQFICGLIYYPVLVYHSFFVEEPPIYSMFLLSSAAQAVSHYFLFHKREFTYYTHYFTEILIHYSMNREALNCLWIASFTLINIFNRSAQTPKTRRISKKCAPDAVPVDK